ncbi:hypothetical protein DB30_04445 [Enhygromyxa salina]|uniref:Uncharacterized protein n=1 Tax=Enhygromyxa salina TaxID=215803 RepID=A0A0C2CZJ7_9BACT|nr:hypothetical protein [Enhygromyxa salina]KIG16401.1 hypothetical protein DB30_04445 [Enhygromyxa salina]
MLRTSLIAPLACALLLRETLCTSCVGGDDSPCEYEVVSLAADAETPWGTTPADDIAALEVPQHGTWRWGDSTESIEIDQSGFEQPAWATYVHDPTTIRFSDHVAGGRGIACDGQTVMVDGTLTITDEQDAVILSVPVTALRQDMAGDAYGASPQYSPISLFSDELHEKAEWDMTQVFGAILWINGGRLSGEFYYHGQSMRTETTGDGVVSLVGLFEADE